MSYLNDISSLDIINVSKPIFFLLRKIEINFSISGYLSRSNIRLVYDLENKYMIINKRLYNYSNTTEVFFVKSTNKPLDKVELFLNRMATYNFI